MTSLSVVIPVYNGMDHLKTNLDQVLALKATEYIIIDDCSQDGSYEYLTTNYPKLKIIRNAVNQGFTKAVNLAVSQVQTKLFMLLNQDVCPKTTNTLAIAELFKDPNLLAVNFNEVERSWPKVDLVSGWVNFTNGSTAFSTHRSFWPSGGSSIISTPLWRDLNGFDPVFTPGYIEDFDLGWRANKRGLYTLWVSDFVVSHQAESTFKKTLPNSRLQRIKDRNLLIAHWKNLDSKNLLFHLLTICDRVLQHPGYLIPLFQALTKIRPIMHFRHIEKKKIILSDQQIIYACA